MIFDNYYFDPRNSSRQKKIEVIEILRERESIIDITLSNGYSFSGRIMTFNDDSIWVQRWDPVDHSLSQETVITKLDALLRIDVP